VGVEGLGLALEAGGDVTGAELVALEDFFAGNGAVRDAEETAEAAGVGNYRLNRLDGIVRGANDPATQRAGACCRWPIAVRRSAGWRSVGSKDGRGLDFMESLLAAFGEVEVGGKAPVGAVGRLTEARGRFFDPGPSAAKAL